MVMWGARSWRLAVLMCCLPTAVEAHGQHGLVHLVTLHLLPWLSDRPYLLALVVCGYGLLLVWAYRTFVARSQEEEATLEVQRLAAQKQARRD
jgi:hypothetical protein